MLGEHDLAGHFCLYEQNLMVPLVIEFPDGREAGRSVSRQTSLVDIAPTILDSLGLEPEAELDGVSLAAVAAGAHPGHAVAWSYAAEGNHGLALRVDNRRKYILRNTVWPFTRAPDELYHLDTDPQELVNLAAASDESEGFRRELRRALRDETSGLRVRVENRGGGLFRGSLIGESITNPGVKSEDLECDCALWGGDKRARLKVPAGQAFTLSLGELRGRRLTLSVPQQGGEPFSAAIDFSALQQPRSFACGRSGCAERECSGAAEVCITVWWAGEGRPGQEAPPEIDESLQRQLEALGYLN